MPVMPPPRPMLATPTAEIPSGDAWVHEIKWDGWRVIACTSTDGARLYSRSGRDVTASFPELSGLVLPDLVLDGEVVGFDADGIPTLGALADRISGPGGRGRVAAGGGRAARVAVMLFDILAMPGHDLTTEPWHRRRTLLESLAPALEHDGWLVPDTHDDGALLLAATRTQGLEGVMSKRRDSPYLPGERSPHWLKRPHRVARSVVVGGLRMETGGRDRLGALLVGRPRTDGRLDLLGRVGSGLAGRTGADLLPHLRDLVCDTCPFVDVPRGDATGARWLRPDLVVDVASLGLASGGRLRQPTFLGVRDDLTPADLTPAAPTDGR